MNPLLHPNLPGATEAAALFDLPRAARECRVVVAMSGGVDSSVVAALAASTGAEVIGVTLQLYDHGAATGRKGACCAGDDIRDARAVADRLGFAHYVFDHADSFRESVVDRFADDYLAGHTPIPCIRCNMGPKFTDLFRMAKELGADCLATGHYVRRLMGPAGPELHRALDPARDQSYFLYGTTGAQLEFLRFPLGGLPKADVRRIAEGFGLAVAAKPDSQDICFVPDGDYAKIVRAVRPEGARPGRILHAESGETLGEHAGVIHYTVGQRRGLEIGGQPEPLYVVAIDAAAAEVRVGPRRLLGARGDDRRDQPHRSAARHAAQRQGPFDGQAGAGHTRGIVWWRGGSEDSLCRARVRSRAGTGGGALCGRTGGRRRLDRG